MAGLCKIRARIPALPWEAVGALLGLPEGVVACLFDLDGVLTDTAAAHNAAWTEMFDEYLRRRAERVGEEFVAFDARVDYSVYVDGKPRADGARDFLVSRGIHLPEGRDIRIRRTPRR
ncbi:MAG: hypothetical protein JWO98_5398 [Frankiales bacterium]|nr:hypothetical protein [Frankiales bacterium]